MSKYENAPYTAEDVAIIEKHNRTFLNVEAIALGLPLPFPDEIPDPLMMGSPPYVSTERSKAHARCIEASYFCKRFKIRAYRLRQDGTIEITSSQQKESEKVFDES
jgi:hypothetical protein